jgi:hypothetical protein
MQWFVIIMAVVGVAGYHTIVKQMAEIGATDAATQLVLIFFAVVWGFVLVVASIIYFVKKSKAKAVLKR